MADTASPTYIMPTEFRAEVTALEDRHFRATGHATARILDCITDPDVRAEVAALLMAMSGTLTQHQETYEAIRARLAQRAYEDGRRDGYEQLGIELGMIERPKEGATPPTMH